jgi:SPX domain protein involved in polyphosphate accumulation
VRIAQAVAEMREKGKTDQEIEPFAQLFSECQKQVDAKQLRPLIRTQYMRTAFQIPFDATVRISLDTSLTMIKESVDNGEGVPLQRWCAPHRVTLLERS